ncbi:MAG TPA: hypothetical protein PK409_05635 [Thermosynergistes sp.]|nr:hypothetical protein [Thermosynergistes sp.]HQE21393.1 hypothetical protein [Thermosynergistes sp.]HXK88634.1 hypothetical protein [Thermosynergistes sp.]
MWVKDLWGNWYMAGQEAISSCFNTVSFWEKDEVGNWMLCTSKEHALPEDSENKGLLVHIGH